MCVRRRERDGMGCRVFCSSELRANGLVLLLPVPRTDVAIEMRPRETIGCLT